MGGGVRGMGCECMKSEGVGVDKSGIMRGRGGECME